MEKKWRYVSDWIDNLHPDEQPIFGNDEFCPPELLNQPDPDELLEWQLGGEPPQDSAPYRDSIGNYWHERMVEKYGPFLWAIEI